MLVALLRHVEVSQPSGFQRLVDSIGAEHCEIYLKVSQRHYMFEHTMQNHDYLKHDSTFQDDGDISAYHDDRDDTDLFSS
jgi:hypothetical protein